MTSKRDRLQAAIAGEVADRLPVALWRHFPVDDQDSQALAEATLAFQREFDFDFIKVTPASSFCLRDWGAQDTWEGATEGTCRYTRRVVGEPEDWVRLALLTAETPSIAQQLDCLQRVVSGAGPETPVVQTVFSPLAQARTWPGRRGCSITFTVLQTSCCVAWKSSPLRRWPSWRRLGSPASQACSTPSSTLRFVFSIEPATSVLEKPLTARCWRRRLSYGATCSTFTEMPSCSALPQAIRSRL